MYAYIQILHTYVYTDIHIDLTYIYTYIHIYIHTYIHTYIHACIHTCIHTYIHKCIQTIELLSNISHIHWAAKTQLCVWVSKAAAAACSSRVGKPVVECSKHLRESAEACARDLGVAATCVHVCLEGATGHASAGDGSATLMALINSCADTKALRPYFDHVSLCVDARVKTRAPPTPYPFGKYRQECMRAEIHTLVT